MQESRFDGGTVSTKSVIATGKMPLAPMFVIIRMTSRGPKVFVNEDAMPPRTTNVNDDEKAGLLP